MVNTEPIKTSGGYSSDYNILNIVVNTELALTNLAQHQNYNILNIVVNTEQLR